jgi:hypothetical protein
MRYQRHAAAWPMLLALVAAGCGDPVRARPEFVSGAPYKTVAVVPPEVSIDKSKLSGDEALVAEALRIEDTIFDIVSRNLASKGYTVKPTLSAAALDESPDMKSAVADLQSRHNDLLGLMTRDRAGVEKGRFSLGTEVAAVGETAGADLLVFVRASGVIFTTSKKVTEAVVGALLGVGGAAQDTLAIFISVVDAKDGRVMATVSDQAVGNFVKRPEEIIGKAIAGAFRKFPAQGTKRMARHGVTPGAFVAP